MANIFWAHDNLVLNVMNTNNKGQYSALNMTVQPASHTIQLNRIQLKKLPLKNN